MKIHKIAFLAFFSLFLYENLQIYGKNTEKLENGVRILKKRAQVPVFDPHHDVMYPGFGQNCLVCISSQRRRQTRQNFATRVILG